MTEKRNFPFAAASEEWAARIRDSANQIWLAGLGAFAKAQEEGNKVFESLVKDGEAVQARNKKLADERIAEFTSQAAGAWDKTWDRVGQVFEQRVAKALHTLNVPTKDDIDLLNQRIAELTEATRKTPLGDGQAAPSRPSAGSASLSS